MEILTISLSVIQIILLFLFIFAYRKFNKNLLYQIDKIYEYTQTNYRFRLTLEDLLSKLRNVFNSSELLTEKDYTIINLRKKNDDIERLLTDKCIHINDQLNTINLLTEICHKNNIQIINLKNNEEE